MKKDLKEFEKTIGVTFKNQDHLKEATVHRSYLNEHPGFGINHNERLEFLGDAVLELVVTENLFFRFDNPEGEMTNWRASLVNSKMLSKVAAKINLEDYILLSKGEQKDTGKARQFILANAVEAVIGAIYVDQGWEPSKKFIEKFMIVELEEILEKKLYVDPKSNFQELSQEKAGITPSYKVLSEVGPDHEKIFEVGVYLKTELVAKGKGTSKQEAQEDAAKNGIEEKGWG